MPVFEDNSSRWERNPDGSYSRLPKQKQPPTSLAGVRAGIDKNASDILDIQQLLASGGGGGEATVPTYYGWIRDDNPVQLPAGTPTVYTGWDTDMADDNVLYTKPQWSSSGMVVPASGVYIVMGRAQYGGDTDYGGARIIMEITEDGQDSPFEQIQVGHTNNSVFHLITHPKFFAAGTVLSMKLAVYGGPSTNKLNRLDLVLSSIAAPSSPAGDPQWIRPTLGPNFSDYNSTTRPIGYRKLSNGAVILRGLARTTGTGQDADTIFTLPVGYRPSTSEIFSTVSFLNVSHATRDAETVPSRVEINPDGTVTLKNVASGDQFSVGQKSASVASNQQSKAEDLSVFPSAAGGTPRSGSVTGDNVYTSQNYGGWLNSSTFRVGWRDYRGPYNSTKYVMWRAFYTPDVGSTTNHTSLSGITFFPEQ